MAPLRFDSWQSYFSFCLAREFVDQQGRSLNGRGIERIGHFLAAPIVKPLDALMREFRNPLVIVALTVSLLLITSIVFYPVQSMVLACRVLPFLKYIRPWHVKGALYIISQTVILGLGLRTLGRLSNPELMEAFARKRVIPIPIGAVKIE